MIGITGCQIQLHRFSMLAGKLPSINTADQPPEKITMTQLLNEDNKKRQMVA